MAASAQIGARVSAGVDYKIDKRLHLKVEEEARVGDSLSNNRLQTTIGLTYKPVKYVKFGVGYSLLNPFKTDSLAFKAPRHRLYADVTGIVRFGDFQFSVKERLQYTHRTGSFNVYQSTPDAFALKSRASVKYKGWNLVEPTLFFESRTQLNAPWGTAGTTLLSGESKKGRAYTYYNYIPDGYTHVYNDRYRAGLDLDIKLSKHHTLNPYVLVDFYSTYDIDTNGAGNRLYSAAYTNFTRVSAGLSYVYSF